MSPEAIQETRFEVQMSTQESVLETKFDQVWTWWTAARPIVVPRVVKRRPGDALGTMLEGLRDAKGIQKVTKSSSEIEKVEV